MNEPIANWTVAIDADTSAFRTELNRSADLGRQFGAALGKSLKGSPFKVADFVGDVLKSLGLSLSRMAFSAAFKPLEQVFANAFSGLATGNGLSLGGPAASAIPTPFAKGGVIASPVSFPLGQGTGIAGERGAEAILPLTRTRWPTGRRRDRRQRHCRDLQRHDT